METETGETHRRFGRMLRTGALVVLLFIFGAVAVALWVGVKEASASTGPTATVSLDASASDGPIAGLPWCEETPDGNCVKSVCSHHDATVIYVGADWCPYCTKLQNGPFKDPRVKERLSRHGLVHIDTEKAPQIAGALGVRGIPALVLQDRSCKVTTEKPVIVGNATAERLLTIIPE